MAATLTGTPTAVTWAAGADPAGQSITVPSDATAVYMFWSYSSDTNAAGISTVTLNGASPNQSTEIATDTGLGMTATGISVWYGPATGSQTLDVAWDAVADADGGPVTIVAYVKDGDTTAWRDADQAHGFSSDAVTVTVDSASGDLVLKLDSRFSGSSPATSAGWTSAQTQGVTNRWCRLSYISASGATQVCDSEGEAWSGIAAVSIPAYVAPVPSPPLRVHRAAVRLG